MAEIYNLDGERIDVAGKIGKVAASTKSTRSNPKVQNIIDHLSYLNQEGLCASLMVAVVQKDGGKTRAYSAVPGIDPMLMLGTLECLKDMIKADSRLQRGGVKPNPKGPKA